MASPTPPAGQAWPHALDPRLVKRLWQRADQPGCIRHSQARAILSRHSRMTGGPPLAGLLQRRSGVAAGAWAAQPPIVTARPTAAAPGPPPLQVMGEGTARPAARAKPAPASGAAAAPPVLPRPPAPVPAPSRPTVRGLVQRSPAAHAAVPPAAGTEPAAAAAARPRAVNDRPAHTAALVTQAPMPGTSATPASAARGGPAGLPGPASGGLPGSQLNAGPRQSGARPAVTAAAPHQPVWAAGIPASTARVLPLVPPLATRQAITGDAPAPRSTPPDRPAGAPSRPVVRAGEGGDPASAALPTIGTLPASGEAGRPSRPVVRERASGSGAPAFTLPKLLQQALLPLAHAPTADRPPARLASAAAGASPRSHPAAPPATPDTGGAGQAQPAGRRAERDGREPGRSRSAPSPADLDRIVGTVQRRLMHQFAIERERRGMGR
jgi:hypothetical protein